MLEVETGTDGQSVRKVTEWCAAREKFTAPRVSSRDSGAEKNHFCLARFSADVERRADSSLSRARRLPVPAYFPPMPVRSRMHLRHRLPYSRAALGVFITLSLVRLSAQTVASRPA